MAKTKKTESKKPAAKKPATKKAPVKKPKVKKPEAKKTVPQTEAQITAERIAKREANILKKAKDRTINKLRVGVHKDATFTEVKHKEGLSNTEIMEYAKTLKGYIVVESINKFAAFSRKAELMIFEITK